MNFRSYIPLLGSEPSEKPSEKADAEISGETDRDPTRNNARQIAPPAIEWNPSYGYAPEREQYFRTYYVDSWGPAMPGFALQELLTDSSLDYDITIYFDRNDPLDAASMLGDTAEKLDEKAEGPLRFLAVNPESAQRTAEVLRGMREAIEQENQNIYTITFYMTLFADTKDQLNKDHRTLTDKFRRSLDGATLDTTTYEPDIGLKSSLPLGYNEYQSRHGNEVSQPMVGKVAARLYPFTSTTVFEPTGVYHGKNIANNTPVVADPRKRDSNAHKATMGRSGSGKTFSATDYILNQAGKIPDLNIGIIDPQGDFIGANHALRGEHIVVDGGEQINPLQIDPIPDHVLEKSGNSISPFKMKLREAEWFFNRYFSMQDPEGLSMEQRGVLSQAIQESYHRNDIYEDPTTHDNESPTVLDVMDVLESYSSDPTQFGGPSNEKWDSSVTEVSNNLIMGMMPFKTGNYQNLAQETNIDLGENPVTYVDLTAIPDNSENMGLMMQVLFTALYQEAKRSEGWYLMTIDEAHRILQDDNSANFVQQLFRSGRHYNMMLNIISQTFEEFFQSEAGRVAVRMCSMVQLHQMDKINEELAKNSMDLNDNRINYLKEAQAGDGEKDFSQALLEIEGDWIPIKIEASPEKQMIIDFDPTDDIEEIANHRKQRIFQALKRRHQYDVPIVNPQENSLREETEARVQKRQRKLLMSHGIDPDLDTDDAITADVDKKEPATDSESEQDGPEPDPIPGTDGGDSVQDSGQQDPPTSTSGIPGTDGDSDFGDEFEPATTQDDGPTPTEQRERLNQRYRIGIESASDIDDLSASDLELAANDLGINPEIPSPDAYREELKKILFPPLDQ